MISYPEAVQKVLLTLAAASGNLKYRRFSKLDVVEMAFRPTFWTASRRIHFPFLLNVAKSAFIFTVRALQLPSNGTAIFFFVWSGCGARRGFLPLGINSDTFAFIKTNILSRRNVL